MKFRLALSELGDYKTEPKSFMCFKVLVQHFQIFTQVPTGVFKQTFLYKFMNSMKKLIIFYSALNSQKPKTVLGPWNIKKKYELNKFGAIL